MSNESHAHKKLKLDRLAFRNKHEEELKHLQDLHKQQINEALKKSKDVGGGCGECAYPLKGGVDDYFTCSHCTHPYCDKHRTNRKRCSNEDDCETPVTLRGLFEARYNRNMCYVY